MAKETNKVKRESRGMPNNIDAEASVLGAILIDNRAADTLVPMLKESDFYRIENRKIFAVMKKLQDASKPIDTVSVCDGLELIGELTNVGSLSYVSGLAEGVVSAANGEYYANIVKRDGLIRRVINAGNDIAKFGYECDSAEAALDNAESLVYAIAEQTSEKALVKVDDAAALALKKIQDVQSGNVPKNTVYTDFPSFDNVTHGLKAGEMVLLAARPSVGKTAFALNIAANVALNHGKKVAIFSLEMPADLLAKRMLSYISKVPVSKMDTRGGLGQTDYKKIFKGYRAMLASGIYIDDYSMNSPSDVLSKCRRLKREQGLDLIIIDYLQLMTSAKKDRSAESRQVEVSDMSRKIKIYAKELDCPILVLSQMSRAVESRPDHKPMLSDLRESGSIEQDADVVMFLNNPSKYNSALPKNEVILDVKKNRNGITGEINLDWDGDTLTFKEAQQQDSQMQPQNASDNSQDQLNAMSAISQIAEDLKEVAANVEDMPFDNAELPFAEDDEKSEGKEVDMFEDVPAPEDDDVPWDENGDGEYIDDDEYVDEDDI